MLLIHRKNLAGDTEDATDAAGLDGPSETSWALRCGRPLVKEGTEQTLKHLGVGTTGQVCSYKAAVLKTSS